MAALQQNTAPDVDMNSPEYIRQMMDILSNPVLDKLPLNPSWTPELGNLENLGALTNLNGETSKKDEGALSDEMLRALLNSANVPNNGPAPAVNGSVPSVEPQSNGSSGSSAQPPSHTTESNASSSPLEEDDDVELSGDEAGGGPKRALSLQKRRQQNRNAQRAFRERRQKHLKELQTRLHELEANLQANNAEKVHMEQLIDYLREENDRLRNANATAANIGPVEKAPRHKNAPAPYPSLQQSLQQANGSSRAKRVQHDSAGLVSSPGSSGSSSGGGSAENAEAGEPSESATTTDARGPHEPHASKDGEEDDEKDLVPKYCWNRKESSPFTFDLDLLCEEMKARATCTERARKALLDSISEDVNVYES